jgi:hypothetical protein
MEIRQIVEEFAGRLSDIIERNAYDRARELVTVALNGNGSRSPGKKAVGRLTKIGRPRRKGPIQLCPVPGCKNRAAPVFGMVCANHKGLPKAKIKKYREARRASKAKGKAKR